MVNKKIILFINLFLILFIQILAKNVLAEGIKVVIETEKDVYTVGEKIEANLKIKNLEEFEKDVLGRAELFAPFYIPSGAKEFFIKLKGLEEKTIKVDWESDLLPAYKEYFIIATIVSGNETISINKSFEVREREVEIFSCLDLECRNQTQIFYVGEKVCISFVNRTIIKNFKILHDSEEKELKLPVCLENLKRGDYQIVAYTDEKNYYLNFSVIMPWKAEKTKGTFNFPYWIIFIFFAILLLFFIIKRKKGQVSFFMKTISIIIASIIFVFIIYYFVGYQRSVSEEKAASEFKNEVTNVVQKLILSEDCLSYKNEKGSIDINKLEYFSSRYKEVEPECAKEMNFDYTITVIQQPKKISVFPAIKGSAGTLAWVVNSGSGNSVSLVASDGREIRRHWVAPKGIVGDPSRTAVDSKGNAWVGNRGTNTLVKIAFDEKDCIDKNGNGKIETSDDKNEDGIVDENEMLPFDEDECIVANIRLGSNSGVKKIRAVCIDKNDNVYAGHWSDGKLFYVSYDGQILNEWKLPNTPYGCVVDDDGNVWVSGLSTNIIAKLNSKDNSISTYNAGKTTYGIWRGKDSIVFTTWSGSSIVKISKNMNKIWEYYSYSLSGARGVFVDQDDNVYAVGSSSSQVVKVDKDGKFVKAMPTCNTPTGISMDSEGNIWVICMNDGGVRIYDKDLNVLSEFVIRGSHYGYSDFTGFQTGAKLGISKVKPSKEIQVEEKTWSFSVGSEKTFGAKSFSPGKARRDEIQIAIPITIRYNETFATEGMINIYAVKGELEDLYGIIDYLCINAKNFPERDVKFSKVLHFSYPVKMVNDNICMLESCKKVECVVPVKMINFNDGEYSINFVYDSSKKTIEIS
jgi:streptogramin lyase